MTQQNLSIQETIQLVRELTSIDKGEGENEEGDNNIITMAISQMLEKFSFPILCTMDNKHHNYLKSTTYY